MNREHIEPERPEPEALLTAAWDFVLDAPESDVDTMVSAQGGNPAAYVAASKNAAAHAMFAVHRQSVFPEASATESTADAWGALRGGMRSLMAAAKAVRNLPALDLKDERLAGSLLAFAEARPDFRSAVMRFASGPEIGKKVRKEDVELLEDFLTYVSDDTGHNEDGSS